MSFLQISNLSLGYGNKEIFSGINAEEDVGCLVALMGSNGRGKSTLLKTIAGLEDIWSPGGGKQRGTILYEGRPLKEFSRKEASGMVSFVSSVMERTKYLKVKDLVGINSYFRSNWAGIVGKEEEKKIEEALKLVGLEGFEGRDCTSLSDGEYQRATIAGALVQDSRMILLDEPTAFLDIPNKFLITKLLKHIAHSGKNKKLVVFSTHDLQLALQICDRLWIMGPDGFFCGTPEHLILDKTVEKMFDAEDVKFDREKMMFVSL